MPEPKRPLKVFLCHAHADRDPVRGLYTRLTQGGVDAWLDKAKLLPGQDWELEIRKAVREADVVVVCLSKQFNQAGFRQKEVRLALDTAMEKPEGEIFIIPARLEECDSLESLRKWHWVDLFEDDGYEMLMRALRMRADKIGVSLQVMKTPQSPQFDAVTASNPKNNIWMFIAAGVIVVVIIWVFLLLRQLTMKSSIATIEKATQTFVAEQISTAQQQMIATVVFLVTQTAEPTSTSTDVVVPIKTSLATEIMDAKGVPMTLVLEGKFTMGSADNFADEKPAHLVSLNSYYIDNYEVTNRNYNLCVQAGECLPPKKRGSKTQTSYFGNPVFDNYPVIYVTWDMAQKYCQWRDARLPSEAEWEKAARGAAGRIYPWGDTIKNTEANYNGLVGDLTVVGKYNSGASPYGLFDMAGNAQEWVNDWYQANYYSGLFGDVENPQGPSTGDERVIRGGSWDAGKNFIRTTYRFKSSPSVSFYNISFRCAKDVSP